MRFMVVVKANKDSEAGVLPPAELFEAMGRFNEELVNAGVMLSGEGLHPTTKGVRIRFSGNGATVTEGPFPLTDDTIAGFWMIKVKTKQEAIDWMKRAPFGGGEIELRQVQEMEDFSGSIPKETIEKEKHLRERLEQEKAS